MMDRVFDLCVRLLLFLAPRLGMTYKEVNVWIFVIIWPMITLVLIVTLVVQQIRIHRMRREIEELR